MVLRVSLIVGVQYEFGACISTQLVGDNNGICETPLLWLLTISYSLVDASKEGPAFFLEWECLPD